MWLDNLKELKKEKGMSVKQIAEETNLPERTVNRIFSGDTDNPYVDTLHRIVSVLGGSLDCILADTKVVVGNKDILTLQSERDALAAEVERLTDELEVAKEERVMFKFQVANLTTEIDNLRAKLELKDEIIAVHNYYIKRNSNE